MTINRDSSANQALNAAGWSTNLDEVLGLKRVPSPKKDSRRDKWIRWSTAVDRDLNGLAINRMVWRTLTAIWRERTPQLPHSVIFDYFASSYAHTQASGIRRQVDNRDDVTSLWRLLSEIADNPERISREWFIGRYEWGQQHLGHSAFQELDPNETGYLSAQLVERDLQRIVKVAENTKKWVNRHVAHLSKRAASTVPTFSELDGALDVIGEVYIRWSCILTGVELTSLEPIAQYDWLAPLRVPWLTDATTSTT